MKLSVGGGCGEHGRNCFFVQCAKTAFIVDCGLMPGVEAPYPRLSEKQIKSAAYLFFTHSHLDHTGAYPWLVERGFSGCVVMTRETARQLSFVPERVCLLEDLAPALTAAPFDDALTVMWGRSGQCAGSVWYEIRADGECIVFSGDYVEDTLVYECDRLRNRQSAIAVLDSAYGDAHLTAAEYRGAFVHAVGKFIGRHQRILLPVPKFGRGLELLSLLQKHFPHVPVQLDAHLQNEVLRVARYGEWIKAQPLSEFQKLRPADEGGFILVSDPQLKSREAQALAEKLLSENEAIVLSGAADMGSVSQRLLLSHQAVFFRYPVHMSDIERATLERMNRFERVVPYHHGENHTDAMTMPSLSISRVGRFPQASEKT